MQTKNPEEMAQLKFLLLVYIYLDSYVQATSYGLLYVI